MKVCNYPLIQERDIEFDIDKTSWTTKFENPNKFENHDQ